MKKLFGIVALVLTFALLLSACGSDESDGEDKNSGMPFGGQLFLDTNSSGYYLPTMYVNGDNSKIVFSNSDGLFYYDFSDNKEYSVPESSGTMPLHRGQVLVNENYIIWQFGPQDLYAYNLNISGAVVKHISVESPMMYSMCVADGYILVMSVNKKVYACDILDKSCISSMPYTSGSGTSSLVFACDGHKIAVGAKEEGGDNYKMLIADWEIVGNVLNFKPASRVEIPIVGEPKQVVMNDKYVAFVNNFNDIYAIELASVEEQAEAAKAYAVKAQEDPSEDVIDQISDLYLYGDILVWSDNTSSYWWPYYADLSSRNETTGLYVKMSQMSNKTMMQKNPCTDGKKVYWSLWQTDAEDAEPVLWVGEIGAEVSK